MYEKDSDRWTLKNNHDSAYVSKNMNIDLRAKDKVCWLVRDGTFIRLGLDPWGPIFQDIALYLWCQNYNVTICAESSNKIDKNVSFNKELPLENLNYQN